MPAETISQAVAKRDQAPTVAGMIQSLVPELQKALPQGMDGKRVARLALTVVRKDPKLAECDPRSFAGALLTAAGLGLEPGVGGEAYLVPYKRECQLIIGYQGYVALFWRSPLARYITAKAVHEADAFDYGEGLEPFLLHKPKRGGDRGNVTEYYAAASLTSGASSFVVLTPDEVRQLRGKEGPNGGIADPQRWMERKTAVRQLVKLLPRSPHLNRGLEVDEQVGSDLRRELEPSSVLDAEVLDMETGEILDAT